MKRTLFIMPLLALCMFLTAPGLSAQNLCGDINWDNSCNVSDVIAMVDYLFRGNPDQPYFRPADVDGVEGVTVSDLTYIVDFLFRTGSPPACNWLPVTDVGDGCLNQPSPKQNFEPVSALSSGCLTQVTADSSESMLVELIGNELHVYHLNAYYQCCLGYQADFKIEGYDIVVQESDTADPCYCMCYFTLEAVMPGLYDLPAGYYTVTLIDVTGDTVGTDTLSINIVEHMAVAAVGNDLRINHRNTWANCCPDFVTDVTIEGYEIVVSEWDMFAGCDCYCPYNLVTEIPDLQPGAYTVTLMGVCDPWNPCDTVDTRTIVVDSGL